ncbi:hypothetical protein SAMN05216326_15216 [Nitrosomonas marina]|uniref:Uncharacterized protein n=1 Tax=Nitrosomonas marina TaxID=917 RepID=A0A1I0G5U5_9PROT|nr:hypothetical protein [Nitrosomonas marina]SET65259.1 hypothetical protein SAMN05216326_15216 [Nitrosomonas marina]
MYSLSSQLFAGVTEYVLNESVSERSDSKEQKAIFGSGRVLGDILKRSDRKSEKKFLNDYSYTIFETELLDKEMVVLPSNDMDFNSLNGFLDKKKIIH